MLSVFVYRCLVIQDLYSLYINIYVYVYVYIYRCIMYITTYTYTYIHSMEFGTMSNNELSRDAKLARRCKSDRNKVLDAQQQMKCGPFFMVIT